MNKFLLFFLSGFLFLSCKKEKDEPAPEVFYFPTSVTRTASYTTDIEVSTYKYNDANQIIREDIMLNGGLNRYYVYSYNAAGKLKKTERFDNAGALVEHDEYFFNSANQATQMQHSMFHQPGMPMLHHYMNYAYNNSNQLLSYSEVWPKSRTQTTQDQEQYSYTYQLNNPTYQKAFYDNKITPAGSYADEFERDGKFHPFSATGLNVYPVNGNVLKKTTRDLAGNVTYTINYSIVYNAAGYPESIEENHSPGGVKKTETYTYKAF